MKELHTYWMRMALQAAVRGRGAVEPNPLVGCVIASGNRMWGHGWHRQFGGPHAEVEAIRDAEKTAARAGTSLLELLADPQHAPTLYVTLEPCCHHGKTPPCTEAILGAGIRKVVVAAPDPFDQVAGRGIQQLRAAGIEVSVGVLQAEAELLNRAFRNRVICGRPWAIAKWAMTADGKMATSTGNSQWISNARSRQLVHQLRDSVDAIIVGSGTAVHDDPQLTVRLDANCSVGKARPDMNWLWQTGTLVSNPAIRDTARSQPLRVVLDRRLRIESKHRLVQTAAATPTLIAHTSQDASKQEILQSHGCELFPLPNQESDGQQLVVLLEHLAKRGLSRVLVEGGSQLLGAFRDADLIDEALIFAAPRLAGGHAAASPVAGIGVAEMAQALPWRCLGQTQLDGDILWHLLRPESE